jgi:hypothetical protein
VYEHRTHRPLARRLFVRRLLIHFLAAGGLLLGSLLLGMAGYAYFEGLAWRDAFLNAAMLLGGEGPILNPGTPGGKLFAGFYALYSGLVFIVLAGIILAPLIHRLLHRFHWDQER